LGSFHTLVAWSFLYSLFGHYPRPGMLRFFFGPAPSHLRHPGHGLNGSGPPLLLRLDSVSAKLPLQEPQPPPQATSRRGPGRGRDSACPGLSGPRRQLGLLCIGHSVAICGEAGWLVDPGFAASWWEWPPVEHARSAFIFKVRLIWLTASLAGCSAPGEFSTP